MTLFNAWLNWAMAGLEILKKTTSGGSLSKAIASRFWHVSLLKKEKSLRGGIRAKRLKAAWAIALEPVSDHSSAPFERR